ncbi:DNA topoisomerase VI subunit B [Thermostilla marina]
MTTPASVTESNVGANGKPKRRRSAEAMAAGQREISVSEFFAKNRHLLGFDSPRRALLTAVKEAVDNALDACEEAGILPEIWVRLDNPTNGRYRVIVQDCGPGIVKKQIPLIFGKLLYGSKFHRLRQSRGQQGIGISAAGMYGLLTTGKPVDIVSKTGPRKPAHFYQVQIDTKRNKPEIVNGRGNGVDIEPGTESKTLAEEYGIPWQPVDHGTLVAIEMEGRYQRGRGSVDEYLEQTAIANPHVTLHFVDPEGNEKTYERVTDQLPPEPKEIKPHPYGVELGRLITMMKDSKSTTLSGFLTGSFSRVSPRVASEIIEKAGLGPRTHVRRLGREQAEKLFEAIQSTKITAPSTDCLSPIGEELILRGLRQVVPGKFYAATTRPASVYRGNPFQVEVGLAYGGAAAVYRVSPEILDELISETDTRTLRQFLTYTFDGIGPDGADKIIRQAKLRARMSPGRLKEKERRRLVEALQSVNLTEGQSMNILRYANRVPLQFQAGACAITQTVINTNWRTYGLSQSRGSLPSGPLTLFVHIISVWVPFTSESKEAIALYPEIQKELRLAFQAVGRKLGLYLRRRQKVRQQSERRNIFLRYLGEVAQAVSTINGAPAEEVYEDLVQVAKKKTAEADMKLDERGRIVEEEEDYGGGVLIVDEENVVDGEQLLAEKRNGDTTHQKQLF